MNLWEALAERDRLKDQIAEHEATMMSMGLASDADKREYKHLVKKLAEIEKLIEQLTN